MALRMVSGFAHASDRSASSGGCACRRRAADHRDAAQGRVLPAARPRAAVRGAAPNIATGPPEMVRLPRVRRLSRLKASTPTQALPSAAERGAQGSGGAAIKVVSNSRARCPARSRTRAAQRRRRGFSPIRLLTPVLKGPANLLGRPTVST